MSHDYRGRVLVVAFLSLTIVWSVAVGFDATDGSLCEDHCGKTFPVHTYPEVNLTTVHCNDVRIVLFIKRT